MTDGQLATSPYEPLAHRLLLETAEQWQLDPREVAGLIHRAAFAHTHRCHPSRCINTDGWTDHNDPCPDPPYPDGCHLEIVRPGKTQCDCETDLCPTCPCGIHLGRCPGYRWDQEHDEAVPCPCVAQTARETT